MIEELTKAKSNLMIELTALCEHMDQVKADTIVEF